MTASEPDRTFLDTNVLVYLFDTQDEAKHERARSLLQETPAASLVLSTQVLSEFYWATTRRLSVPLDHAAAATAVDRLCRLAVVAIDKEMVRGAIELAEATSIAYWDALVVRAASFSVCQRLFTEDLNHGQVIDGVRVENPFLQLADG